MIDVDRLEKAINAYLLDWYIYIARTSPQYEIHDLARKLAECYEKVPVDSIVMSAADFEILSGSRA